MYRRFYLFITLFLVAMAMIISSTIAADTNNTDCEITHELYSKYLGIKGLNSEGSKHTKKCTQPGCFYIFKQNNLWKKWAPSLFARGLKDKDETIMGCRYDIPYLIQRTHGAADRSLHKILEMLRACFIRNTTSTTAAEGDRFSFCQPEYSETRSPPQHRLSKLHLQSMRLPERTGSKTTIMMTKLGSIDICQAFRKSASITSPMASSSSNLANVILLYAAVRRRTTTSERNAKISPWKLMI